MRQKLHPTPEKLRQKKVQFAVDWGRPYVSRFRVPIPRGCPDSADLAVEAVLASGDADVIEDAKTWEVNYAPNEIDPELPGAYAGTSTGGVRGDDENPWTITTSYLKPFDKARNNPKGIKFKDGITVSTKDAFLIVIGLHELSHGSAGNSAIPAVTKKQRKVSEADVGVRVRKLIKHSPTVKDGYQ